MRERERERAIKRKILLEWCNVTEIKGGCDTWDIVSDQCAVVFCVFIEMSQTYMSHVLYRAPAFFPCSAQLSSLPVERFIVRVRLGGQETLPRDPSLTKA